MEELERLISAPRDGNVDYDALFELARTRMLPYCCKVMRDFDLADDIASGAANALVLLINSGWNQERFHRIWCGKASVIDLAFCRTTSGCLKTVTMQNSWTILCIK